MQLPEGDAALTDRLGNPLLTLASRQKLMDVDVEGMPVSALIHTRAQSSFMSAHLSRRLRKVVTRASSPVVREANSRTPTVL